MTSRFSDFDSAHRDLAPSIITAAFAAAGGRRDKMHELIPDLVLALQANDDYMSPFMEQTLQLLGATATFRGELLGWDLEESTKRLIISISSPSSEDEVEHVRTWPMWSPVGKQQEARLKSLGKGRECRFYVYHEPMAKSKKGHKARVLAHIVPVGPSTERAAPPKEKLTEADQIPFAVWTAMFGSLLAPYADTLEAWAIKTFGVPNLTEQSPELEAELHTGSNLIEVYGRALDKQKKENPSATPAP